MRKQGRCRVRNLQDGSDGGRLCLTEKRESHQYPKGPLVMNCTFLQSSMRPWGGFLLRLWREVSVNSQKEKHGQHESTGSLSRFMFGFDRFSWRSARSRARTPGDSTLTLILCQDVEHHCKQFESVRLRFSFLLPRIAALSEAWWV